MRTIVELRRALALTQAQLAELTGVHAMTVSKWERGVLRPARHQRAILDALAVAAGKRPSAAPARELAGWLNRAFIDVSEVGDMQLSASNQLKGKIVELEEGPISARVVVEIAPRVRVTSVITTASSRRLRLKLGKRVVAIVKATEVIIGAS